MAGNVGGQGTAGTAGTRTTSTRRKTPEADADKRVSTGSGAASNGARRRRPVGEPSQSASTSELVLPEVEEQDLEPLF